MVSLEPYMFAILGGIIPALIWLWFFLREDRLHPEPRLLIALTFVAGMASVFFVLPIEKFFFGFLTGGTLILVWAAAEELFKYFAAFMVVLWRPAVDEPIDPLVYMITSALGFSACENILFVLTPFISGNVGDALITGNLRFMGAALLHTLASAMIGGALAFSFYRKEKYKRMYVFTGFVLAVLLHTIFNFFIIGSSGGQVIAIFSFVWIGIIALFLIFEKVKLIQNPLPKTIRKIYGTR